MIENQKNVRLSTVDAAPEKSFETWDYKAGTQLVPTHTAAKMLLRTKGTLLNWACHNNGLIKPIRVGRRLGWPLSEIEAILAEKSEVVK